MGNYTFTSNMKLKAVANKETSWFREWVYNFDRLDRHDHSSEKGIQIPTAGIADGAITTAKLAPGVAVKTYLSSWISSTGTAVFTHSLPGIPSIVQLQYADGMAFDGFNNPTTPTSNDIIIFGDGSHIKGIGSTDIVLDFNGLTIDSTHRIRICAIYIA